VPKTRVVITDYIEVDLDWEVETFAKVPDIQFEYHQLKLAPKAELIEKIKQGRRDHRGQHGQVR